MTRRVLLMVGTSKGAFFFFSDAGRSEWSMTGPFFKGWEVSHLLFDPRSGGDIYASLHHFASGIAIHRSSDLGQTWTPLGTTPAHAPETGRSLNRIWCLATGAKLEPETLYAGVDEAGLFVSRDRGQSWTSVAGLNEHPSREVWIAGHGGLACHWIHVDPNQDQRLWAAISIGGVFRSEDGGTTWQAKNSGLPLLVESPEFDGVATCVHGVAISSQDPNLIYQQNHRGLFRTRNGADSWEPIENGLGHNFGLPIAVDPNNDQRLFSCPIMESEVTHLPIEERLEVWASSDGGERWQSQRNGLPTEPYFHFPLRYGLAVDGLEPCGVYLGTTAGDLFFSRDGGEQWAPIPEFERLPRILSVEAVVIEG